MVFMFASTNLVLELGVVLLVLMGWQFAAAEFIGGPIMIVLLVAHRRLRHARPAGRAGPRASPSSGMVGGHDHQAMVGVSEERQAELERSPWRTKLRSQGRMVRRRELHDGRHQDAAQGAGDRLRRSPGFLAVLVPMDFWNDVFLKGHGFWTSLENVIVGPFIAFISFVCSIGNVPMAAALWHGGISFGGVISFIFADLIALPLVLIYRKYYGTRLTLRLFFWFYAVMAAAGSIVEGLFSVAGLIPTDRPENIVDDPLRVELHDLPQHRVARRCSRSCTGSTATASGSAAAQGYAIDPVCGMQVETAERARARDARRHRACYFCSDHCRERFETDPVRFAAAVDTGVDGAPPPPRT